MIEYKKSKVVMMLNKIIEISLENHSERLKELRELSIGAEEIIIKNGEQKVKGKTLYVEKNRQSYSFGGGRYGAAIYMKDVEYGKRGGEVLVYVIGNPNLKMKVKKNKKSLLLEILVHREFIVH